MKTFRCDSCGHALFFENVQCLHCGSALAFLPDRLALCAIEPAPRNRSGLWRRKTGRRSKGQTGAYRLCRNNTERQACNFALAAEDPNALCVSCRQTRILSDLSVPDNRERWYRIERDDDYSQSLDAYYAPVAQRPAGRPRT
jgi:hypothetical protein